MTSSNSIATCIACKCTDTRACLGGCSWLGVNRDDGTGVCSNCPKSLAAWRHQQVEAWNSEVENGEPAGRMQVGPLDI